MKLDRIDKFLVVLSAASGIITLLIQGGFLDKKYQPLVAIVGIASLALEALWVVFGKRQAQAKQAEEVLNKSLDALRSVLGEGQEEIIRANIMVPKGICVRRLYIKYLSSNMENEIDRDISLERWEACAGQAWAANRPLAANLVLHHEEPGNPQWILRPEIEEMTSELKVLVSYPIRNPKKPGEVIGVLNVDSKEAKALFLLDHDSIDKIKAFALLAAEILENLGQI